MATSRNILRTGAALSTVLALSACGGLFGGGGQQQPQAAQTTGMTDAQTTGGTFYQDPKAPGGRGYGGQQAMGTEADWDDDDDDDDDDDNG
jgi:hypothetical protein